MAQHGLFMEDQLANDGSLMVTDGYSRANMGYLWFRRVHDRQDSVNTGA